MVQARQALARLDVGVAHRLARRLEFGQRWRGMFCGHVLSIRRRRSQEKNQGLLAITHFGVQARPPALPDPRTSRGGEGRGASREQKFAPAAAANFQCGGLPCPLGRSPAFMVRMGAILISGREEVEHVGFPAGYASDEPTVLSEVRAGRGSDWRGSRISMVRVACSRTGRRGRCRSGDRHSSERHSGGWRTRQSCILRPSPSQGREVAEKVSARPMNLRSKRCLLRFFWSIRAGAFGADAVRDYSVRQELFSEKNHGEPEIPERTNHESTGECRIQHDWIRRIKDDQSSQI